MPLVVTCCMAHWRRPYGSCSLALAASLLVVAPVFAQDSTPPSGTQEAAAATPAQQAEHKQTPSSLPLPPWAEVKIANAVDHSGPVQGRERTFEPAFGGLPTLTRATGGPSTGLQVNLATGIESYLPKPDITVRNGLGSDVLFQRNYRSDRALQGYGSPGLSPGWVHNYDIVIKPLMSGSAWSELTVVYPSGEKDYIKPVLDDEGAPTGEFLRGNGAPFVATGKPGATANTWEWISLQWVSGSRWVFSPFENDIYALQRLDNLQLSWSKRRALLAVNEGETGKPWITFAFDATGHLKSFTDRLGRSTAYAFGPPVTGVDTPYLLYISNRYTEKEGKPDGINTTYGYHFHDKTVFLDAISIPSPSGKGISTAQIGYIDGRVAAHVDGNLNQRCYTYTEGHTRVEVKEPDGKVIQYFIQNFDSLGRNIGTTDANGGTTHLEYEAVGGNKP